jgi:2-polyprenyl-6-methoxyphenol hydroxylase-like FAD-dependent oxidoreductase
MRRRLIQPFVYRAAKGLKMSVTKSITIVGGGLAGLTLGIGLRQREIPVMIFEAGCYPRHRVCGEFISGNGQTVLERLGLLTRFEQAGAIRARTAIFFNGTNRSPVRQLAAPALCLSRYKMDTLLAETFQQLGGELRVNSRWTSGEGGEGIVSAAGRRVQSAENGARWFGVKAHVSRSSPVNLEADLEMHLAPSGYIGVTQINDGEVNVCGLFRAHPGSRPPESKLEWLHGETGSILRDRLNRAQFEPDSFCSVAGLSLKPQRAAAKKECCIGDALTMTPPVTGNGMSMAFESAEMAIEPLAAYSLGRLDWTQAQKQIALRCDAAFLRRLAWARLLQWLMISPMFQGWLGKFLLRSDWLWRLMFAETR